MDGKSNYKESFGAAKMFYDDSDGTFKTFCLLDRDYNEQFNSEIAQEAIENKVNLHILHRLEIENYLIIPKIFADLLHVDVSIVENKINEFAELLKGETFDRILEGKVWEYRKLGKNFNLAKVSKETREYMDGQWSSLEEKIAIVPGKEMKAKIFEWMQQEYSYSCSGKRILQKLEMEDIPEDLLEFFKELWK